MMKNVVLAVAVMAAVAAWPASGQQANPVAPARERNEEAGKGAVAEKKPAQPSPAEVIKTQLGSGDTAAVEQGLAGVRAAFAKDAGRARGDFLGQWAPILMRTERYAEVEQFAWQALLVSANDTGVVEQLEKLRVQALLAADKTAEAQAEARALYNVASMKGTAEAIRLVAQTLKSDPTRQRKFKDEQLAGEVVVTDTARAADAAGAAVLSAGELMKAGAAGGGSPVLAGIPLGGTAYAARIKALEALEETFGNLTALGNLYLLAGDPDKARDAFERAYAISADKELPAATESLARAMKAKDGTVGRANAWILSLRPKPPPPAKAAAAVEKKVIE